MFFTASWAIANAFQRYGCISPAGGGSTGNWKGGTGRCDTARSSLSFLAGCASFCPVHIASCKQKISHHQHEPSRRREQSAANAHWQGRKRTRKRRYLLLQFPSDFRKLLKFCILLIVFLLDNQQGQYSNTTYSPYSCVTRTTESTKCLRFEMHLLQRILLGNKTRSSLRQLFTMQLRDPPGILDGSPE